MENKLISVIVTTCNRKQEILKRALDSVAAQTYRPIEMIVIIDQPSTAEELTDFLNRCYGSSVKVHANTEQMGACYSRNKGITLAKGEYIAFLDDDDEWLPKKLEKQSRKMLPGVCLVYSDYEVKAENINVKHATDREFPSGNVLKSLLASNFIGGSSVPLLRAETLKECGSFDMTFPSCQDYDVWVRMAMRGKVDFVKEVLSYYYVSPDSITNVFERRIQGWEKMLVKYGDYYAECPESLAEFLSVMIEEGMKRGYVSFAGKQLKRSFAAFPRNFRCILAMFKGLAERMLGIY